MILLDVIYGCEARSLTLMEERRVILFEIRILRQIFGPNRDENGEWRRFQNEELHSLYHLPNIVRAIKSRRLRWAGHVAKIEKSMCAFKMLTRITTGKKSLGRLRRR